jgi:signal transduction histidine kinase
VTRLGSAAVPWGLGFLYVSTSLDSGLSGPRSAAGAVLGVVIGVLLARRLERPVVVAGIVIAAEFGFRLVVPSLVIPFAGLAAMWSLSLARPPRISLLGLVGVSAVASLNGFRSTYDETVFVLLLGVSVWALAEAARNRIEAAHEAARRGVTEEQARIARELHDVIAHGVSVMVVQAAAAGDVFDHRPDQARAAIDAVEHTGREVLGELRRLLAAVRPEVDDGPPAPPPGLAQLDDLAEQLRAAGLDVVIRRDGRPVPLPAGVDLSAYRIVQEALTNTLRHAHATVAEVTLRYRPDAVEIEVVDDGRAANRVVDARPGLGLIGMRERTAVLGGTFAAGPTAHGSFRVTARLPIGVAP